MFSAAVAAVIIVPLLVREDGASTPVFNVGNMDKATIVRVIKNAVEDLEKERHFTCRDATQKHAKDKQDKQKYVVFPCVLDLGEKRIQH